MSSENPVGIAKSATGIHGLDVVTHGGLPTGRVTLFLGGAGSGKTVSALQTLVHGAQHGEPGIFVAFEERSDRIIEHAAGFGWDLTALAERELFFLDVQPSPDLLQSGTFDLLGMTSALAAKAKQMGARRIVFDSLDVVLLLLDDERAARRELGRLHAWLAAQDLTAVITAKADPRGVIDVPMDPLGRLQFMADCVLTLGYRIADSVSHRSLRVVKLRGSSFHEGEVPMLIGPRGLQVAAPHASDPPAEVSSERVSSGVADLDAMLGGGYLRGAGVLITGAPGTAKTTLAGAFTEAAAARGEKTLFVSFDSPPAEVVRNLASVGIDLGGPQAMGLVKLVSASAADCSAEAHALWIRGLAEDLGARNLVIDPLSALAKRGDARLANAVVERLVRFAKAQGMTLLCSSLLDSPSPEEESTPLEISTIADTWVHLTYVVRAGERNRALSIIKSRGTAHSNQVRELELDATGVTLADVYIAGGEVLMGSMRWEQEQRMAQQRAEDAREREHRARLLAATEADLLARHATVERELEATRQERASLAERRSASIEQRAVHDETITRLRGGKRRADDE